MTKFIAFVSGKGGTGKTTASINVGQALVQKGIKAVVLDANLVTPNVALQLGLVNPPGTINKFLRKEKALKEVMYLHGSGLTIIPASPSFTEFQKTNALGISQIFGHLQGIADIVLVDAPSGLGIELSEVLKHCDEAIVVANPNLSSVMDALKTIKLAKQHQAAIAGILLNMSNKGKHELPPEQVEEILGSPILADVRYDKKFRKAMYQQVPLTHKYRWSRSARQFRQVASFLTLEHHLQKP